jgi:hypothetical protein
MNMNWIILLLIALIVTVIVFAACGVGGGLMMLVALNGFSESDATPILIFFALIVIGISIALSTAASWVFIKSRHAETAFRFWHVAGIIAGVNILTILIIFSTIAILRLQE